MPIANGASAAPILLLLFPLLSFSILCRTGVDHLGGPVADCGKGRHQCLNTTSSLGQTVYSCDFGGICDSILNLRDECVRDGERMVCCCSTFNGCNFGPGGPLLFARNQSKIFGAKDLNAAALKSSTALDFLKKLETGSDF